MKTRALLICIPFFFLISCEKSPKGTETATEPTMEKPAAAIQSEVLLDSIPSGSGLAFYENAFYLITDDSPYFFKLDAAFKNPQKFRTNSESTLTDYRLPKLSKPDFECLSVGKIGEENYLVSFGSGSKSPERDLLLLINLKELNKPKTYSLTAFYNHLKKETGLTAAELNIEGAAILNNQLYLLNRGKNLVIRIKWPAFISAITQAKEPVELPIKYYRVQLPLHNNIEPGFSGACRLGNENKLLFCASVENTKDWVADGEIMGSYIGILNLNKLEEPKGEPVESFSLITTSDGNPATEKIESVEITGPEESKGYKIMALTDDDKGSSKVLHILLKP